MIQGLVKGTLKSKVSENIDRNGAPYFTTKLRVPMTNGDNLSASVHIFDKQIGAMVQKLDVGDAVCFSGDVTVDLWTLSSGEKKPCLRVTAYSVITPYHMRRKRDATKTLPPQNEFNFDFDEFQI